MRPSISRICPRSVSSLSRRFNQTAATQPPTGQNTDRESPSGILTSIKEPTQRGANSERVRASKPAAMDTSNIQWWAKPAPNFAAPPNQTNGGFTIPGLGNSAPSGAFPFPTPQNDAAAQQPSAPEKPAAPTGPRKSNFSDRDKILAPSLASGGVPDPTPEYLHRASMAPTVLPSAKPILIVMDLNGTLLYRPSRKNATSFIERPHAKRFLQYCLDTFHVVVWSSARPANVQSMCDQLLLGPPGGGDPNADRAEYRRRVLGIWGRDKFGLSKADYNLRVQVYKRLDMVWRDPRVMASHPDYQYGGRWDQSNTVLIDDSVEKARSEPYNLLRIPEFFGDSEEPDFVVPQVHDYLNSLCYQSDISAFMRTTPFQVREDYELTPAEEQ